MIRVLIVDDQALIREGLNLMLDLYDVVRIVGEANNGKEAIDFLEKEEVDVILMDIKMPLMDGVEATRVIKDKYPNTKIIILTTFNEDEYIFEGLKNGADGYVLKDVSSKELVNIIKSVYDGDLFLHGDVAGEFLADKRRPHERAQLAIHAAKPLATTLAAGDYERAVLRERAAQYA